MSEKVKELLFIQIVSSVRVWLARLTQRMTIIIFGAIPSLQIHSKFEDVI